MTWQRTLVVLCPFNLTLRQHMRHRFAYVYVTIVPMLLAVLNSYFLRTHDILNIHGIMRCTRQSKYDEFSRAVRWVDLVFASILPFCLIFIGNILIIRSVVVARRQRRIIAGNSSPQRSVGMTTVLLIISFTFLMTTLPISIYLTLLQFFPTRTPIMRLLSVMFTFLSYVNNCINFYLYIISGKKFRRELKQMVCCKETRGAIQNNHTTATYTYIANTYVMSRIH